jgi:hypothetical protein
MSFKTFAWVSLFSAISVVSVTGCDDGSADGTGGTAGTGTTTSDTGGGGSSTGGAGGMATGGAGGMATGGAGGMATGGAGGGDTSFLDIDFDDAAVMYTLAGFGGAEDSTIVADPTDAANKVARVVKTGGAELWAGTTASTMPNNSIPALPFMMGATKMTVRVWSPDAGIQVRLKVEDAADPTHSCETEATTTIAGAWETLEFDFTKEAMGTAALNFGYTFSRVSIFFNFGVTGAMAGEKTYYFDNLKF